jgi:hypothetical protein
MRISRTYNILPSLASLMVVSGLVLLFLHVSLHTAAAQADINSGIPAGKVDWLNWIGQVLGNFLLYVSSYITWFGGMLLDSTLNMVVFKMGEMLHHTSALGITIGTLWTLIRDIANLAFIFGFIYLGIRTIIDSESASTKRMLAQILIGAVLINFSLLFSKLIIDFGNLTAVHVYKAMVGTSTGGSIAQSIADILGVSTLYRTPDPNTFAKLTSGGNFAFYVMGAAFLMIAGFVLAAGALLLLVRFVALVFIMVFSPILFAATVFPNTAHYARDLWVRLINYSFFAPVYLLLLYVSLKVLGEGIKIMLNTPTLDGNYLSTALTKAAPPGSVDSFSVVLVFMVAIFFLIMSLKLANQLGMVGGKMVVGWGDNLRQRGQRMLGNATFGAAAAAGRGTFGRYAYNKSEDGTLKQRAATSWTARQQLKLAKSVAGSSFDARKVGSTGKAMGIGEGKAGGFKAAIDKKVKEEKEYAKSLGYDKDAEKEVNAATSTESQAVAAAAAAVASVRTQMKDATAPMRKAISETSAKMLTASSEEQKKNYADQIRGYREAIENEEKRIADDQKLEDKENDLKKAKAAKDARINEIKASRGEAYADTLDRSRPYRWFYGNRKAAEAIRETTDKIKDKGKDKSDTEELAEKLNEMLEKNKGDEKKA